MRVGLILTSALVACSTSIPEQYPDAGESWPDAAIPTLDLPVADPFLGGYNRDAWRHWIDADGDCQDTRQEVLIVESEVPVTFDTTDQCKVASGQWTCPYTGLVFKDPRDLDIDHMVPLYAAHAAGGYAWDNGRREDFANELQVASHLIAVSASANRSKGASGPEQWLPSNQDYVCQYVKDWIDIKLSWELSFSESEKKALEYAVYRCEQN